MRTEKVLVKVSKRDEKGEKVYTTDKNGKKVPLYEEPIPTTKVVLETDSEDAAKADCLKFGEKFGFVLLNIRANTGIDLAARTEVRPSAGGDLSDTKIEKITMEWLMACLLKGDTAIYLEYQKMTANLPDKKKRLWLKHEVFIPNKETIMDWYVA